MEPTVGMGAFVLTKPTSFAELRRRDVVVFRYPQDRRYIFVKRVIGLPGDEILIRDKHLFVNGQLQDEGYVIHTDAQTYPLEPAVPDLYRTRDQFGPYVVPPGHFFALGDSRDRSRDSRFWGPVPQEDLRGRVICVLSPASGFTRIHRRLTSACSGRGPLFCWVPSALLLRVAGHAAEARVR
jgi:signal peptidase I